MVRHEILIETIYCPIKFNDLIIILQMAVSLLYSMIKKQHFLLKSAFYQTLLTKYPPKVNVRKIQQIKVDRTTLMIYLQIPVKLCFLKFSLIK